MKKQRGMTAAEHVAELNADPEFLKRRRAEDERLAAMRHELQLAERPVVQALNDAGLGWVRSVWDLVNTAEPYPRVLDILVEHLQRDYPPRVLEGIGRALAVPESRRFWSTLLRLFRSHPDGAVPNGVKWSIGCALSASVTEDVIDDVVALIGEPRHGENRIVFLKVLMESPSLKAQAAFEQAGRDSQLMKEARFLKRLRDRRVRKPKMQ